MDWKKFAKRLLFPPIWLLLILIFISTAALIWVFMDGKQQTVTAYITYALSFYTLSVVCVFCGEVLPKQYGKIKKKIYNNPLGNRYMTDRVFRTMVSLSLALTVNLLYVGIHMWSWHFSRSWWFVVLAVYYVIMAVMRFLLVRYVHIRKIGTSMLAEWKRSRLCAYIMLLVNISLSGAVLMILYNDRGYYYPGIMIYMMAMYTFYSTIHAIVDIVKYRKLGSPILSTAKIVSLSAAFVSMLNLETAMFAQFGGEMTPQTQRIFIILTGAGVSMVVVTLSANLIIKATKEIRRLQYGKK